MAKRKIELTDAQSRRNAEILSRLESERQRLLEETRALQQQEKRRSSRKRNADDQAAAGAQRELTNDF